MTVEWVGVDYARNGNTYGQILDARNAYFFFIFLLSIVLAPNDYFLSIFLSPYMTLVFRFLISRLPIFF